MTLYSDVLAYAILTLINAEERTGDVFDGFIARALSEARSSSKARTKPKGVSYEQFTADFAEFRPIKARSDALPGQVEDEAWIVITTGNDAEFRVSVKMTKPPINS